MTGLNTQQMGSKPGLHLNWSQYILQVNNNQQQPFNGRLSGTTRVGRYQKKHSPAHTHPGQRTSFITFLHLQRSTASALFGLRADSPLEQPLSRSSLVVPLVLNPQLHTPCISSPNHHHLFAAHAHANAACSAAISMLHHLHIVSLSAHYFGVCLLAKRHTSTWPFSSQLAEVPPHFLSL